MMFDAKPLALILIALGLIISFVLWAFRLIPWWGVLVGGVGLPLAALAAIIVLAIVAWMAGGSH